MKVNNNNKNGSNAKKIIPAVGMLSVSAVMLASSTFAWFTMNKEVEVTGLNMTATVPEDLQISLGRLGATSGTTGVTEADAKTINLASGTGFLTYDTGGTNADNGAVKEPTTNAWDWSNTVNISNYYAFGKLMPASSTNGATIFYTPDATGSGRTVSDVARYYAANIALAENATGGEAAPTGDADGAKATLHAYISADDKGSDATKNWKTKTGGYVQSDKWDDTNDDGYYVDVPVWFRSSAKEDIGIAVSGYVLPGSTNTTSGKTETELELYRAVRVAILKDDGTVCTTNNILPLVDAWDKVNSAGYNASAATTCKYTSIVTKTSPYALPSGDTLGILDSAIYRERLSVAGSALYGVSSIAAYASTDFASSTASQFYQDRASQGKKPTYATYTQYDGTTSIATIAAPTAASGSEYGAMKKLIIRVWLDGEDEECWNDNAGQDWAISLKFDRVAAPSSTTTTDPVTDP